MAMDQGIYFLNLRSKSQDLETAQQYFLQARDILESVNPSDSAAFVRVYYRLANAKLDMSFCKGLSLAEKESHLQKAEEYGGMALEKALQSSNAENLAKMKLEQAFLKARRTEIEAKMGSDAQEVRRLKDEALRAIVGSLQELKDANYSNYGGFLVLAENWQARLAKLNM
jgi:hypothetical protein